MTTLSLGIWGTWLTLRHLRTSPPHLDAPFGLYPVSILKPLKGADAGLRQNLEVFFQLDYPDYELLFSVASARDPAVRVVTELMDLYPKVKSRLILGQAQIGPNPKVNNLVEAYDLAENDLILISDSNVRVQTDYLKRLVAHLDNGVGMVTSIVSGRSAIGIGAELDATYLNTFYARNMMVAAAFGRPCVVGKCMLFRRSVANRFGGIKNLARYIAEDFMAGEAMRRLGLKVIMTHDPVEQHMGSARFSDFWKRHVRWGRLRKAQAPLAFVAEPLASPFLASIVGAIGLNAIFGFSPVAVVIAHLTASFLIDLPLLLRLGNGSLVRAPGVWLIRELLALPLWCVVGSGREVEWRGQKLLLGPGGVLETT